ncbi:MAG: hypothetical protein ACNA7U_01245 [Candidatus Izemoplasmataceae bacterium]
MKISFVIQKFSALLIFLVGLVFAFLAIAGVQVTINQSDVNAIIFGLATIIAAAIEFVPMILGLIKDKDFRELMAIVNDVVYAIEDVKGLSSREKKIRAMTTIREICDERDIEFDSQKVSNMIESVIYIYNKVVKP